MRLRRLKVEKSKAGGGLFDGADVWFGRDEDGKSNEPLAPLCLIGPNGSGSHCSSNSSLRSSRRPGTSTRRTKSA